MPILPLPQFEEDLKAYHDDLATYEKLAPPKTIVVRYGRMKMIGEFPYSGDAKPGCGSKMVVKTFRGTEIGEMLTSTCPNSGCSKSVSRQDMLRYIENSGGRDYPFSTAGGVLRVANREDLDLQAALEQNSHALKVECRRIAETRGAEVKVVDVEPILGQERLTIYYASEERLDLRDLHSVLEHHLRAKVDLRHVGARDEARLTADYERCGQYCCCKNFLKVLKPVSMKSAKIQKATLDPLKISGRCGRLMCCLRYEDQTYDELRKRLPKRKTRVGTPEGDGLILDTQILTQLALVLLDRDGRQVAIAIEELTTPVDPVGPPVVRDGEPARAARATGPRGPERDSPSARDAARPDAGRNDPDRSARGESARSSAGPNAGSTPPRPPAPRPPASGANAPGPNAPRPEPARTGASDDFGIDDIAGDDLPGDRGPGSTGDGGEGGERRRRRRRRRNRGGAAGPDAPASTGAGAPEGNPAASAPTPSTRPPTSTPTTSPPGGLHTDLGERRAEPDARGRAEARGERAEADHGPDGDDGPDGDGGAEGTPGPGGPAGEPGADGQRRRRRRRRRRGGPGGAAPTQS